MKMNMAEFNFIVWGKRALLLALSTLLLWAFAADGAFAARYYVKPTGSDSDSGTSWTAAFQTITHAIDRATTSGDEVWVEEGTYAETETITVSSGISLFGGFAGTETELVQRNWTAHATIIDGQNAHQCVSNDGILDGFRATKGRDDISGGGICNFNSVTNCKVYDNTARDGGGIDNIGGSVTNCTVYDNTAQDGGGIWNNYGSITNCIIYGNTATDSGGGVVNNDFLGSDSITNCMVIANTAHYGGGICNYSGSVTNCTVYNNIASVSGGGIYNYISYFGSSVTNCIVWRNSRGDIVGGRNITYSCFGEGTYGEGNLRCNPLFVNTSGDISTWDLYLRDGSPCVDAGILDGAPATDIVGAARPGADGKVCMGAFESPAEYKPQPPRPSIRFYVKSNGGNDEAEGTSWTTALQTISQAMTRISNDDDFHDIWVAEGTYAESATIENPTRVTMYGGFVGTEMNLSHRDWTAHITIIDGREKRQCVWNAGILDGFCVTKGMGMGDGGGIYNTGSVMNCIVYDNTILSGDWGGFGGGIYNSGSVTNCTITSNTAAGEYNYGGGIYNDSEYSNAIVTNCTVYSNTASSGGGIYSGSVTNCIVWGNGAQDIYISTGQVSYSCFKEGASGTGNLNTDPLFINTSGDISTWDLRLQPLSPCIDKGTSVSAPLFDILDVPRPQGAGVDMGAYEWMPLPSKSELINAILGKGNIPNGDVNGDGKVDVADLVTLIINQP